MKKKSIYQAITQKMPKKRLQKSNKSIFRIIIQKKPQTKPPGSTLKTQEFNPLKSPSIQKSPNVLLHNKQFVCTQKAVHTGVECGGDEDQNEE
jgi:hypothetical protein